jgi:hypothetical protein
MNIPQSIEWLQSQSQKVKVETEAEKSLLQLVNVQTGLIAQINEELLQLRLQHVESQKMLCDFMATEGFNYPANNYKCKD